MTKETFFMIFLLSLIAEEISQVAAGSGDCSIKEIEDAGLHLYYYQLKNLTLSADDEIYMQRCSDQLDSADLIMCYVHRCVKEKGAEFLKRAVRAAQYEVLHVCHPHADPQQKKAFMDLTDCHNSIWPQLHACAIDYAWNMAGVAKQSGIDVSRYCCGAHEGNSCIINAAKSCPESARNHFDEIASLYLGDAVEYVCGGSPYHKDPDTCKDLPPVSRTGDLPPLIFDSLVDIANAM